MIASLPVALTLTVLFLLTGGYALLRWSGAVAGSAPPGRRTSELAHLLMSVAMVVMTWTWYGTAGLWFQILLFGGFAVFFAADAVRRRRLQLHGCTGGSAHALMAAAMVWMLAAMPLIMPAPVEAPAGGGGHTGHAGHGAGADEAAHVAGQAGWAVGVTVVLCAALLAVAGFWTVRALAADDHGHAADGDFPGTPLGPRGGAPTAATTSTATAGATGTATAERPAPGAARPPLFGPRTDAGCHALMSIGMVVMLAAMVAGW
ncbi:DUF5134 domain-containing protein [Pseudonocardia sp. NPDC049635]|uniref:DUF5134 domain-containing protein n=1 Tax=Pseudonocardia sp. NPDC049635 TaxID=3155506 RepID=UPI0033CDACE9